MVEPIDVEAFLRAFPDVEATPTQRERAQPVAAALRAMLDDEDLHDQLARALYWPLFERLRADGKDARTASRLALRQARLAVLLLRGFEQRQAARLLEVSERTAKLDADQVRGVIREMRAA